MDVGELHVRCEEVGCVDHAVEREAERHRVHARGPETSVALPHLGNVNCRQRQAGAHWRHDDEHLELETTTATHRQQQAAWESSSGLVPPAVDHNAVVRAAVDRVEGVVPHAAGPGPVFDHSVHLDRVAHDRVLAGVQFVQEAVDLEHVITLVVDVHETTHAVVLGTDEDAHDGIHGLVGDDVHGDLEGMVVEAALASHEQHIGFLFLQLGVVEVNSVGDIHVVFVHESDEFVGGDRLNLDSGEVKLVPSVCGQHVFVEPEDIVDALHETPEQRVAEGGRVHVNSGRDVRVPVILNELLLAFKRKGSLK